jgi:diguanylate cyclase (GGDEF)-like protein
MPRVARARTLPGPVPVPAGEDPAAVLRRAQDHLDRSEPTLAKDLVLSVDESADPAVRARALSILARCHQMLDEYAEGMTVAGQALALCQTLEDRAGEAVVRAIVARMLIATGDIGDALVEVLTALEVAEASGDLAASMTVLGGAGIIYLYLDQLGECLEFCERAAETARLLGDELTNGAMLDTMACANMGLADTARADGDELAALAFSATAQSQSRRAMAIARRLGHRRYEATAVANLAESLAFCGRTDDALHMLSSWRLDPERDSPYTITHHLDTRGCICLASGRYEEAVGHFAEALAAAEGKTTRMTVYEHLADACERSGDLRAALDHFKQFHMLYKQVSSEAARRSGSVAVVRLETVQAKALAEQERVRAAALQHSNRELLRQSLEDPLTGLANRRSMDGRLDAGMDGYAVVLIDVDNFKKVNDTYSHLIGDDVLRHLAKLLRVMCRADDTAVRFGGEEFAILLNRQDEYSALATAERLRALVEEFDWSVVVPGLTVTVSIGVACGNEAGSTTAVLALADQRMYAAKRDGRNRVRGR